MPPTNKKAKELGEIKRKTPFLKSASEGIGPIIILGVLSTICCIAVCYFVPRLHNAWLDTLVLPALVGLIINLATLAFVYFVWHEGRDHLRGISFMDGVERNRDFLYSVNSMRSAPHDPVRILDTAISTLIWGHNEEKLTGEKLANKRRKHLERFDEVIINTLKKGITIQILLLHPNSVVAIQRAKDRDMPLRQYVDTIDKSLAHLHQLKEKISTVFQNDENVRFIRNFQIKLYDKLPSITAYSYRDYVYLSFFPHDKGSDEGQMLKILRSTELAEYVTKQFDSLFNNTSIDIDDFMKLALRESDKVNDKCFYLQRDQSSESLFSALRPTHIAISDTLDLDFADDVVRQTELTLFRKIPIRLDKNKPPGEQDKIKDTQSVVAYVNHILEGDQYLAIASKLEDRYGRKFVKRQSRILQLDQIGAELEDLGWAKRSGDEINTPLKEFTEFRKSWDNLGKDEYILQQRSGITRTRTIAKYYLDFKKREQNVYWLFKDGTFRQSNANHLHLTQPREFAIISKSIATNKHLINFIVNNLRYMIVNGPDQFHAYWQLVVHQIRVYPSRITNESLPTVGLRQDGHDYISMHLLKNEHTVGGDLIIADSGDASTSRTEQFAFKKPFDSVYLDDKRKFHDFTKLSCDNEPNIESNYIDMLLIDYEKTVHQPLVMNSDFSLKVSA